MREELMFTKPDDLHISHGMAKDAIFILQDEYKKKRLENRLCFENDYIPENIITLYYYYVKSCEYKVMVHDYKRLFIENESIIEPNVTKEEKIGLGLIYDYLKKYDFNNEKINIFVESLKLHCMLYAACPHPEFGGKLRTGNARLKDVDYEVPPADVARAKFQHYLYKKIDIDENNILDYIDGSIRVVVDLIKLQPFIDGNKRTFRALLNLLLGKIGIPPIYISSEEKDIYRTSLIDAIITGNYENITKFYYYKICDSIVELDLMNAHKKDVPKRNRI